MRYRRERWQLPSGETVVAALPKGASSHFGPELKRFVLSQYHQGQVIQLCERFDACAAGTFRVRRSRRRPSAARRAVKDEESIFPLGGMTRRKISAGTRSDAGRDSRDAFLGLMKTCAKQAISFWDYLGDRLGVPDAPPIARLAELIRAPAAP